MKRKRNDEQEGRRERRMKRKRHGMKRKGYEVEEGKGGLLLIGHGLRMECKKEWKEYNTDRRRDATARGE